MLHKLAPPSLYCTSIQILGHSLFLKRGGAKFELDVDAVGVYFNIDVLTTPSYVILDGLKQSV